MGDEDVLQSDVSVETINIVVEATDNKAIGVVVVETANKTGRELGRGAEADLGGVVAMDN